MTNRFSYNSRRNKVNKTIKDYLIPIAGIIIVLIILFSIFSGWDDSSDSTDKTNTEISATDLVVNLDDPESEAYILDEKEEKKLISSNAKIKPLEKLVVKDWSVTIENETLWSMKLNKMWELELDKKWVMKLNSSDLWIEAKKGFSIDTMYSKIRISAWSVVSINQNEILSTVYVISWSAEVSNLVWKKTLLGALQKLIISNQDASNEEVDLALSKDNLDEFFKSSEWYTKNNWDSYMSWSLLSNSWSTNTSSWSLLDGTIELNDLRDEMVMSSSKIAISWKYSNDFVSYITLDWVKAKLDTLNKTFSFWTYTLTKKENDLVFKLFDTDGNVISKIVYTFYYNWAIIQEDSNISVNETPKTIETTSRNYQVDGSKFLFTAPGSSPYTTTETFVTIRWQTPSGISKVIVNWHALSSFNWSTWRYHANSDSDNFKDWTNVYEVKYYWDNWKLVYTNSFVIIKKPKVVELPADTWTASTTTTQ